MNVAMIRMCLACASVAVLGGCTTTLSGSSVKSDKTGIRYSLPAPHIVLNPQPDGTVVVEVKYLPDPNNTYSLNLDAYLSTATFNVTLVDGMLTQVALNTDSSATAVKAITTATELEKARKTEAIEAAEASQEAADAEKEAVKQAASAVRAQKEKIELLEAKLAFATKHPGTLTDSERRALELLINQERVTLAQLERHLASIDAAMPAANTPASAFMDPTAKDSGLVEAYGPVFFRVLPDGKGGVTLSAVEAQRSFQTSTAALAPKPAAAAFKFEPAKVAVKASGNDRKIGLRASGKFEIVGKKLFKPANGSNAPPVLEGNEIAVSQSGDQNSPQVTIMLPDGLPKGTYRLDLEIRVGGSQQKQEEEIEIAWLAD